MPGPDEGEWDPQPADLREGETTDVVTHIQRNIESLREADREGVNATERITHLTRAKMFIEEWRQKKESKRQMVHRLREWEAGDTLFGWESVSGSGSMGKTYTADELSPPGEDIARSAYEQATGGINPVVFYRATIDRVTTDSPSPTDPGEPPMKHASLSDVMVIDYHIPDGWFGD